MKLIIIFGNAAVGKMTVGQELTKITDLKLFHNHMTIEPVLDIFGYFNTSAILKFREIVFEEFAKSNIYGLIFTCMWALDEQSDWDYIEHIKEFFKDDEIYFVELFAPQEIRLQRNTTENRLNNKPSKRDIDKSTQLLINDDKNHRFVSYDGEIPFENYIKIDNTNLSAQEATERIKKEFAL